MSKKEYCDLCESKEKLNCIKMLDQLWVCIKCRIKYYTDKEIKESLTVK